MLLTKPDTLPLPPVRVARKGTWLLVTGVVVAVAAAAAAVAAVAAHPLQQTLTWFDLRVYEAAGQVVRHSPASLYSRQMLPRFWYTYTPFAAMVFSWTVPMAWGLLTWLTTGLSVAALGYTVWATFGALGWRGRRRLGMALAVSAVALWTEPVTRTLRLGQVDLLLMAMMVADLCQRDRRWWKGAGIGLAAAVKLVPLIFIPYLVLTRRFRQAFVAAVTFTAAGAAGFVALPHASAQWWFGPDFLAAPRTGFVGFLANESLRGLFTRASGAVWAGMWWWLDAAAVAAFVGLWAAVRLHRAGRPVEGWLTCALTGLLVSPISWDHHWVWVAPALAALATAAVRAGRWSRWAWWLLAGAVTGLFGAWPNFWSGHQPLVPVGLIWYAPGSANGVGSHPWDSEYHWHGFAWPAGNLYVLVGVLALAGLALAARRDDLARAAGGHASGPPPRRAPARGS